MINWLVSTFGTYTPVTYTDGSGVSVIPSGMAGVDWQYLAGVFIFCIFIFSLFRFLGGIFRHE